MSRYHKTYSPPIEKKTVQNKLNKGCCNYMDLFKKPTKKKKRKEKKKKIKNNSIYDRLCII